MARVGRRHAPVAGRLRPSRFRRQGHPAPVMRLFVGIPLPEAALDVLERVQAELEIGRPVAPENLHLTLAFLDEHPGAVAEEVHNGLVVLDQPGFAIRFVGVEAKGRARVKLAWARVEGPTELAGLHDAVRGAARAAGVDLPRARFRPHVTLARFGAGGVEAARLAPWLAEVAGLTAGPYRLDRFCLYRSTLTPEGPIYDVLAEYDLA